MESEAMSDADRNGEDAATEKALEETRAKSSEELAAEFRETDEPINAVPLSGEEHHRLLNDTPVSSPGARRAARARGHRIM